MEKDKNVVPCFWVVYRNTVFFDPYTANQFAVIQVIIFFKNNSRQMIFSEKIFYRLYLLLVNVSELIIFLFNYFIKLVFLFYKLYFYVFCFNFFLCIGSLFCRVWLYFV